MSTYGQYDRGYDPNPSPFDDGQTPEQMSENTVRGLRIFGFYVLPAAILLFVSWQWIEGLFWPLLALSLVGYFAWRLRDWPVVRWVRERTWDVVAAWFMRLFPPKTGPIEGDYRAMPSVAWEKGAQDDNTAWAMTEYARVQKLLPGLSRDTEGDGYHERRKVLLYKAELEDALLSAGHVPPVQMAEPAPSPRLGLLSSVAGVAMGKWPLYALGASLAFGGFQFVRAEIQDRTIVRQKDQIDDLRVSYDQAQRQVEQDKRDIEGLRSGLVQAAENFEQAAQRTAETNARIRRENQRLATRLRAADEQAATRNPGDSIDWTERLRLLESSSEGAGDNEGEGASPDSSL